MRGENNFDFCRQGFPTARNFAPAGSSERVNGDQLLVFIASITTIHMFK